KERIYLDKNDNNILHNEITVFDHALTRPWTVTRDLRRNSNTRPVWREFICTENNPYVTIGTEIYFLSADGLLMPMRKGQPAPDRLCQLGNGSCPVDGGGPVGSTRISVLPLQCGSDVKGYVALIERLGQDMDGPGRHQHHFHGWIQSPRHEDARYIAPGRCHE